MTTAMCFRSQSKHTKAVAEATASQTSHTTAIVLRSYSCDKFPNPIFSLFKPWRMLRLQCKAVRGAACYSIQCLFSILPIPEETHTITILSNIYWRRRDPLFEVNFLLHLHES